MRQTPKINITLNLYDHFKRISLISPGLGPPGPLPLPRPTAGPVSVHRAASPAFCQRPSLLLVHTTEGRPCQRH